MAQAAGLRAAVRFRVVCYMERDDRKLPLEVRANGGFGGTLFPKKGGPRDWKGLGPHAVHAFGCHVMRTTGRGSAPSADCRQLGGSQPM